MSAIGSEKESAVASVESAKTSAMQTIGNAATEIENIKTEADTVAAQAMQQANSAINEVAGVQNSVQEIRSGFTAMEALLSGKVDGGYVENDSLYLTSNGEVVAGPFTGFGGGSGSGGGSTNTAVLTMTNATGWVSSTITSGSACTLLVEWSSIEDGLSTGNGSLTVKVGGSVKAILDVPQGVVSVPVGDYLKPIYSSSAYKHSKA